MEILLDHVRRWTVEYNGQYPRPWMTDLTNPQDANVFVVGMNQAKAFDVGRVSLERHIDALFNRNGETCRGLYDELEPKESPTRRNIDALSQRLRGRGINRILETNVICYSTPMSADLAKPEHAGGKDHGKEIFRGLLRIIQPKVIFAHGAETLEHLAKELKVKRFDRPENEDDIVFYDVGDLRVYPLKSLANRQWNKWYRWADSFLDNVSDHAQDYMRSKGLL